MPNGPGDYGAPVVSAKSHRVTRNKALKASRRKAAEQSRRQNRR